MPCVFSKFVCLDIIVQGNRRTAFVSVLVLGKRFCVLVNFFPTFLLHMLFFFTFYFFIISMFISFSLFIIFIIRDMSRKSRNRYVKIRKGEEEENGVKTERKLEKATWIT